MERSSLDLSKYTLFQILKIFFIYKNPFLGEKCKILDFMFAVFFLQFFKSKLVFIDKKYLFLVYNSVNSDISKLDLSNETIKIENFHFSQKL